MVEPYRRRGPGDLNFDNGETGHLIIGLAILNASAFYMHFEDDSNITRTLYRDGYKFVDEDGIEYREVD